MDFKKWFLLESTVNQEIKTKNLQTQFSNFKKSVVLPQYFDALPEATRLIVQKWLFWRQFNNDRGTLNGMDVLAHDTTNFAKQFMEKPDFTFADLKKKNDQYHEDLKNKANRVFPPEKHSAPMQIVKEYSNKLAWAKYVGSCSVYGQSMNHCGNAAAKPGDNIYTFYDTSTNIHYLTFIVNKENRTLGEAKAYMNSKPPKTSISIIGRPDLKSVPAQPVYRDFFMLKDNEGRFVVEFYAGGGAIAANNLTVDDLDENLVTDILETRPDFTKWKTMKFNKLLSLLDQETKKYHQEYKNLTDNQMFDFDATLEDDEDAGNWLITFHADLQFKIPTELFKPEVIAKMHDDTKFRDKLREEIRNSVQKDRSIIQEFIFPMYFDPGLAVEISDDAKFVNIIYRASNMIDMDSTDNRQTDEIIAESYKDFISGVIETMEKSKMITSQIVTAIQSGTNYLQKTSLDQEIQSVTDENDFVGGNKKYRNFSVSRPSKANRSRKFDPSQKEPYYEYTYSEFNDYNKVAENNRTDDKLDVAGGKFIDGIIARINKQRKLDSQQKHLFNEPEFMVKTNYIKSNDIDASFTSNYYYDKDYNGIIVTIKLLHSDTSETIKDKLDIIQFMDQNPEICEKIWHEITKDESKND